MDKILTLVKRWREIMITMATTAGVMSGAGLFIYKGALAEVVLDTANKAAIEVVEKRLKPIQLDIQNIKLKIYDIQKEFDTVNSQQAQVIDGILFVKEILIEQDEVTYQKVKKKRNLRNN